MSDLTPELRSEPPAVEQPEPGPSLRQHEHEQSLAVLSKHRGRKAAAAAELGISRSPLWRKLYDHHVR